MDKYGKLMKKTACMVLVFCMLLFCMTGCGKKDTKTTESQSDSVTEAQTGGDATEEAMSGNESADGEKLPIAKRDCELAKHPVSDNPGFYEIDCRDCLADIEWIYTINIYDEQLVVLYEDSNMKQQLALIDPFTMEVTGPVNMETGDSYYPGLFTDEKGRLVVYNWEEQYITYYNQKLEAEEIFGFENVASDTMYFSDHGEYGYYYDYVENAVMKYDIHKNEKTKLYDMTAVDSDYCMINGVLQDRYIALSYLDGGETSISELYDMKEERVAYSGEHMLNALRGYGESYSLLYEMDGIEEIVCGDVSGDAHIFALPNFGEYNNTEREQETNSLITYETDYDSEENSNTVLFRGYDMGSGQMKHAGSFFIPDTYCVTGLIYRQDSAYMPFVTAYDKPVIFIWDLLEEACQVSDDTSYLKPIPDPDNPDEAELRALKERAKTLGERFGVDIMISDEIDTCPVFDYEYTRIENPIRIEQTLNILETELAKYPEGMLAQLDDDMGSRLQIYLSGKIVGIMDGTLTDARGIENTIDGVTFVVVNITDVSNLVRTIHHEIFHAIENHINCEGYYFDYDRWTALNPDGFEYDYDYTKNEQNTDWDYITLGESDVYFVDMYSKSFPHEDRARIMEYAMTEEENKSQAFTYDGIAKKHAYICEQIRLAFDTTGWPEQTIWESVLPER